MNIEIKELNDKKNKLLSEIKNIDRKIERKKDIERKQKNYERFKKRPEDEFIGKAHSDLGIDEHEYSNFPKKTGITIYITGNGTETYHIKFKMTEKTKTFFHNVWDATSEYQFQMKLNEFVKNEVMKIMNKPEVIISLLSINNDVGYNEYPDDKLDEIKNEIQKEQFNILDGLNISELMYIYIKHLISSGNGILKHYFTENVDKLPTSELKCKCGRQIKYSDWIIRKRCEKCRLRKYEGDDSI